MNGWLTVAMLLVSNVFMTFAWYGHLKLQELHILRDSTPLYVVILLSWGLALMEYAFQVPANRYGFVGNGGAFTLLQLKVIQEVISITVFTLFTVIFFRGRRCSGITSPPLSVSSWQSTSFSGSYRTGSVKYPKVGRR